MSTAGWQPNSWQSYMFTGFNTDNNVGSQVFAMPESGTVTQIWFYCAGRLQAINAQGCIWDNAGNLLTSTGVISVAQGGTGTGLQQWNSGSLNFHIAMGTNIRIGWWRNPANGSDCIWSFGSGNTSYEGTTANSGGAGAFAQDSSFAGQIGCYIVYTADVPPPPPPQQLTSSDSWLYEMIRRHQV